jgi:hypothetical protein
VIRVVARLLDDLLGAKLQFRLIPEFPMREADGTVNVDRICIGSLMSPCGYDQSPARPNDGNLVPR